MSAKQLQQAAGLNGVGDSVLGHKVVPDFPTGTLEVVSLIDGTYVSGDELERAAAFDLGYAVVCQHPNEIGVIGAGGMLVLEFDHVLFNERFLIVLAANLAADYGALVGIHTFHPTDVRLERFLKLPNVVVAKTHAEVLAGLRQLVQRNGYTTGGDKPKESEAYHADEGTAQTGSIGSGVGPGAGAGDRRFNPDRVPAIRGAGRSAQKP